MRCVFLDDYQSVATSFADWSTIPGLETTSLTEHRAEPDEVVAALIGAEVVVAMRERTPLPRSVLERLPDLRLLVTTGMRNAAIDLEAAAALGVTVCGTGSSPAPPAELTWALVHALTRHVVAERLALVRGEWQTTVGVDLAGSTLGLLGLGRIGTRVAAVGRAFDMDVVAWSPHLTPERAAAGGARLVGKRELFERSDIVSLHLVLSEATRGTVGERELAAMSASAVLVNTARAGLVDTPALLAALDSGALAGAGLDVFDTEPMAADDPLRAHPRVVATPHLGYVTDANYRRFFTDACEDVAAWLRGAPVRVLAAP